MVTLIVYIKWDLLILLCFCFFSLPRTLELFVESLLTKTLKITNSRNAKTLSTSHMKQCIMSEQRFDFLRELVRNIPDISVAEEAANYNEEDNQSSPEEQYPDSDTPYDLSMPSTSLRAVRQQQHLQQQQQQHHLHHHQINLNGHNNNNNNGGGQYDYLRNHLKRSMSSNPGSVIRHTTGVDCVPAKLARSDSTPVPQQTTSIPTAVQQQPHSRLKHQSYSMPTPTIIDSNCNKPNINNPPTQLRSHKQQTAIPAPIVSIDYCNKPVVKIDYSNLPLGEISRSTGHTIATPLSAPANIANMSNDNSAFNFSAEQPVINIDLSNIVNASTGATTASSIPSVATISIGTPTLQPPPSNNNSSKSSLTLTAPVNNNNSNKTKATTANVVAEQQSRNSKVTVAQPLSSSSSSSTSLTAKANALATAAAAATMTTATTKSSDSYLEMDEDYDNI